MRLLYLDTTSSFLYCGVVENKELLKESKLKLEKELSVLALVKIKELLDDANLNPEDIDKIIVVNGPGSYTGIRVGITIAKTFAWGLNKRISVISSLEAMALSCDMDVDYYIPVIDARRNFVFGAIYDENNNPILKNKYISLESLKIAVDNLPGKYVYITNDEIGIDDNVMDYDPDILKIVNHFEDKEEVNPHSIDADYLKLTEAEENKQ